MTASDPAGFDSMQQENIQVIRVKRALKNTPREKKWVKMAEDDLPKVSLYFLEPSFLILSLFLCLFALPQVVLVFQIV